MSNETPKSDAKSQPPKKDATERLKVKSAVRAGDITVFTPYNNGTASSSS